MNGHSNASRQLRHILEYIILPNHQDNRYTDHRELAMGEDTELRQPGESRPDVNSVHREYYSTVYRYIHYRLDDEAVCEDLASDVFLRFLNAIDRQKEPIHNVRGWLLGTASHLINDHLRAVYRHQQDTQEDLNLPTPASVEDIVDGKIEQETIRKAIQRLTPDQQHVLVLRFAGGYSLDETAEIIGKTVGAVKIIQFRGLASMRKYFIERQRV
jgi:RNA polymerase sigma-70 factor (ECF subfamily)